jgi:YgiT-type zinc finger domain-containing protein
MSRDQGRGWQELTAAVEAELEAWHAAQPAATLAEIEEAVEQQVSRLRAQLVQERLDAAAATDGERPACPACGGRLQARGRRRRTLTVRGGHAVHVERPYYTCAQCERGLFPPR